MAVAARPAGLMAPLFRASLPHSLDKVYKKRLPILGPQQLLPRLATRFHCVRPNEHHLAEDAGASMRLTSLSLSIMVKNPINS